MIVPEQTTFRNMNASAAVAARVREEAEKLDKYFRRITSLSRRRIDTIDMATRFTYASSSECRVRDSSGRMSRR